MYFPERNNSQFFTEANPPREFDIWSHISLTQFHAEKKKKVFFRCNIVHFNRDPGVYLKLSSVSTSAFFIIFYHIGGLTLFYSPSIRIFFLAFSPDNVKWSKNKWIKKKGDREPSPVHSIYQDPRLVHMMHLHLSTKINFSPNLFGFVFSRKKKKKYGWKG